MSTDPMDFPDPPPLAVTVPTFATQQERDGVALEVVDHHPRLSALVLQRHPFALDDEGCEVDEPHWNVAAWTVPAGTEVAGEGEHIEDACRALMARAPDVLLADRR